MKRVKDISNIRGFKELSKKEGRKIVGGVSAISRDAINSILAFFYPYL